MAIRIVFVAALGVFTSFLAGRAPAAGPTTQASPPSAGAIWRTSASLRYAGHLRLRPWLRCSSARGVRSARAERPGTRRLMPWSTPGSTGRNGKSAARADSHTQVRPHPHETAAGAPAAARRDPRRAPRSWWRVGAHPAQQEIAVRRRGRRRRIPFPIALGVGLFTAIVARALLELGAVRFEQPKLAHAVVFYLQSTLPIAVLSGADIALGERRTSLSVATRRSSRRSRRR